MPLKAAGHAASEHKKQPETALHTGAMGAMGNTGPLLGDWERKRPEW